MRCTPAVEEKEEEEYEVMYSIHSVHLTLKGVSHQIFRVIFYHV
jgi:hypothetical protein